MFILCSMQGIRQPKDYITGYSTLSASYSALLQNLVTFRPSPNGLLKQSYTSVQQCGYFITLKNNATKKGMIKGMKIFTLY